MNNNIPHYNNKRYLIINTIISSGVILIWYLIIEPQIVATRGHIYSQDIFMFWNALKSPINKIYDGFGYIYPPIFWYQFYFLRASIIELNLFIVTSQLIGFPFGLYLINRKYSLRQPYFLTLLLGVPFAVDVALRNFNTYIFLIISIMIYLKTELGQYTTLKKQINSNKIGEIGIRKYLNEYRDVFIGLLFILIGFKITPIIIILLWFPSSIFIKIFFKEKMVLLENNQIAENEKRKLLKEEIRMEYKIFLKFLIGLGISVLIIYLSFIISNININEYLQHVISGNNESNNIDASGIFGGLFNIDVFLTLSRSIHLEHTIWIIPIVLIFLYNLFIKFKKIILIEDIYLFRMRVLNENILKIIPNPKEFYFALIISGIVEATLGIIGVSAFFLWSNKLYL